MGKGYGWMDSEDDEGDDDGMGFGMGMRGFLL